MGGFPLAAGRRSYAEGGAQPPSPQQSRPRVRGGKVNVGPGHTKCFGKRRPIVIQDYVRRGISPATDSSRRRADGQRPYVLLHLRACAEPLIPKFEEDREQAAEGQPYEAAREGKYLRLRRRRRR